MASVGDALLAVNQTNAAQSGLRVNAVFDQTVQNEYEWVEPKTGFFATVFPSDASWHPLYDHDYLEITQHLANAEKITDANKREHVKKRIKEIVVESYPLRYMKNFYISLIIIAVIMVLWYLFKSDYLLYGAGITALISGYLYMQAEVYGQGEGIDYWSTYMSDLSARLQNNSLEKIERDYMEVRQKDADRAMIQKISTTQPAATGSVGSGMGNSFAAGLLGGILGARIK